MIFYHFLSPLPSETHYDIITLALSKQPLTPGTEDIHARLRRLRRGWVKFLLLVSPRILLARLRQRRFSHVISLGSNCEVAFRFWCRWKFVDSSLFAWSFASGVDMLVYTLRHLDDLCAGPLEINKALMWACKNTGLCLHGQLKYIPGQPLPPPDVLDADKANLLGRVAHLKDKLRLYASDDRSTLFAYRLPSADCEAPGLAERLNALEEALHALCSRNWQLLIITERRVAHLVPKGPNRLIRSVSTFNPTRDVANAWIGDPVGWHAIFTEFAPDKILKTKKKFKFE